MEEVEIISLFFFPSLFLLLEGDNLFFLALSLLFKNGFQVFIEKFYFMYMYNGDCYNKDPEYNTIQRRRN